jgi:single-stranded DNA-specific DHH superfamily exonuclease
MYMHPDKVVLIARLKGDEYKCSIRSMKIDVRSILNKSLVGIVGHGGGHEHACGAGVNISDWQKFLENFRRELKTYSK